MVIQVGLEVESCFSTSQAVRVSGYVGDHRVTLWFPLADPVAMRLLQARQRGDIDWEPAGEADDG